MTLFIASLFLPYSVSFDNNHHAESKGERPTEDDGDVESSCYFSPAHLSSDSTKKALTIPPTPGATTETEKIFIPDDDALSLKLRLPTSQSATNLRALIRPEQHSPVWGKIVAGNQPKSKAKSPPPASILKHPVASIRSHTNGSSTPRRKERSRSSQEYLFSQTDFSVNLGILGNGGLISALDAASDSGILEDKTWVGTLGIPTDAIADHVKSTISERLENDFESLVVFTNDSDLSGHYEHYCKTILWPVLHYQIPDHPKSKAYEDHSWVFYVRVNQAFADRIVKNWKRGDTIWIHDYHLLLVPGMIRKQIPDAQIGFYLHTAFPSSEIFRCLAVRSDLLDGILGANLIGFQAEEYVHHFLQTCGRLLNVEATTHGVILEDGRLVHVGQFPIGIDPPTIDSRRQHEDVREWMTIISQKYAGKKLIVARDKLDSVRGIKQKMLAYELFLQNWPEYRNKVVLIQIATSTTEDPDISSAIADVVTRINSTYSTLAHQPLVFLKQDINYSQWLGLLMVADGLMIMSLREGMNLTGHEFIYCQDGEHGLNKHSPLIISEFTGSAALLENGALLVNPWDLKQCAKSIKQALDMSANERQARWESMYRSVVKNDAINWYKSYIESLEHAYKDHSLRDATSVPRLAFASLSKKYENASGRLLLLDYEGTLASWGTSSDILLHTPKKAIDILNDLIEDSRNTVYVMSSRRADEMVQLFKLVPGLGIIAENGAYLLEAGSSEWLALVDSEHVAAWKAGVKSMLEYYEQRIEKSKIEELDAALIFNYAATSDKPTAFKQAGECANHINDACQRQNVHALPIDDGLYISDIDINKSSAAQLVGNRLLNMSAHKGVPLPEFLLVIGDSREDEYVFDWAHKMGTRGIRDVVTVTVGQRNTVASCTLTQGVTETGWAVQYGSQDSFPWLYQLETNRVAFFRVCAIEFILSCRDELVQMEQRVDRMLSTLETRVFEKGRRH